MATFIVLATEDGGVKMTDHQRATWKDTLKKNANKRMRITLEQVTPESTNQRRFYHGAVLPLWCYLDGNDYKSSEMLAYYHEIAKREFNPKIVMVDGKKKVVGMSSKGSLNAGYIEKIIDYLVESYGIDPAKVLNVDLYKDFRDRVNIMGDYDTFIDYMRELKLI